MVNDIVKDLEGSVAKAHDSLKRELAKVRTGRANLALLDGVRVDYYGTPTPLNQVASLSTPDARLIVIKPWEKKLIPQIEEAIRKGELGVNPNSDGEVVRIPIPALTEERRRELTKVIKRMGEDARVAIRNSRREANEMLKEYQASGDITEDDHQKGTKLVQTVTDKGIEKVDELASKKEAEIMEV
ncbi:MAG TPA: ribosome recycling factor [Polyangia bacterium]|nr:ribosome recycling factor [Polyangia bacterium]